MAFQCLRGVYKVHSVNARYVLMPKCEVIYGTHKNYVFEFRTPLKLHDYKDIYNLHITKFIIHIFSSLRAAFLYLR